MANVESRVVQMKFDNAQFQAGAKQTMNTLDQLEKSLQFQGAQSGLERVQASMSNFSAGPMLSAIQSISDRFSTLGIIGMTVTQNLTNSVMGFLNQISSKITGVFDQIRQGGSSRALNLEQARFMLTGLINDAKAAEQGFVSSAEAVAAVINGPVNNAVAGTRFGLDEAAVAASNLYASGITDMVELEHSLQAISGAATMTNREYQDMARIFATVKAQGRLMGDQLLQFSSMGLNVAAAIAETIGKTESEVRDMVSKGQITYEMFADTMYKFWDLAEKANSTFSGSAANVRAQLSKIGEAVMTNYYQKMIQVNVALINFLKTLKTQLKPVFDVINNAVNKAGDALVKFISSTRLLAATSNIIKGLTYVLKALTPIGDAIARSFKLAFPDSLAFTVEKLSAGFRNLAVAFSHMTHTTEGAKTIEGLEQIFNGLFAAIKLGITIFKAFATAVSPIIRVLGDLGSIAIRVFGAIAQGFTDFANAAMNNGVFQKLGEAIQSFLDILLPSSEEITGFGDVIVGMVQKILPSYDTWNNIFNNFGNVLTEFKEKLKEFADQHLDFPILDTLKQKIEDAKEHLGGFDGFLEQLQSKVSGFGQVLAVVFTGIVDALNVFVQLVTPIFDALGESLKNWTEDMDFNTIMDAINITTLVTIGKQVQEFFDGITGKLDAALGLPQQIKSLFGELSNGIERLQTIADAKILKEIAISVGILAGSIFLLSTIDSEQMTLATGAIAGLLIELTKVMEFINGMAANMPAGTGKNDMALGATMIELAIAIGLLADALAQIAPLVADPVGLFTAMGVITAGILGLIGALKLISDLQLDTTGMLAAGAAMIEISIAMNLMAGAIALISGLDPVGVATAIGALGIGIGVMTGALMLLGGVGPVVLAAGAALLMAGGAMLLISIAILTMAAAIAAFGAMDPATVATAIAEIAAAMVVLGAVAPLAAAAGVGLLAAGAGMLVAGAGMMVLAAGAAALGAVDVGGVAANLLILGAALTVLGALSPLLAAAGAALIVAGAGMIVCGAGALVLAAGMGALAAVPMEALIANLVAIGAAMTAFAAISPLAIAAGAALGIFGAALLVFGAGAAVAGAGMLLVATALGVMGAALKTFKNADTGSTTKQLLKLAPGIVAIGVAGVAAIPGAAGIALLAASLAIIAVTATPSAMGIKLLKEAFKDFVKLDTDKVKDAMSEVADAMKQMAPLSATILTLGTGILGMAKGLKDLVSAAPGTAKAMQSIADSSKKMVEQMADVDFTPIIQKFSELSGKVTTAVVSTSVALKAGGTAMVMNLMGGVTAQIPMAISMFQTFFEALATIATSCAQQFTAVGTSIITNTLQGFIIAQPLLMTQVTMLFTMLVATANTSANQFQQVGTTIVQKIIAGVTSQQSQLINRIQQIITAAETRGRDTASKFQNTGLYIVRKIIEGIDQNEDSLVRRIVKLIETIYDAANEGVYDKFYDIGENMGKGILEGLKAMEDEIIAEARRIARESAEAAREELDEHSPSKVFYKIGAFAIQGMIDGMKYKSPEGVATMAAFVRSLSKASTDFFAKKKNQINFFGDKTFFSGSQQKMMNKALKILTKYKTRLEKVNKQHREATKQLSIYNKAVVTGAAKEVKTRKILSKSQKVELQRLKDKANYYGTLSDKEARRMAKLLGYDKQGMKILESQLKHRRETINNIDKLTKKQEKLNALVKQWSGILTGNRLGMNNLEEFVGGTVKFTKQLTKELKAYGAELYASTEEYAENTAAIAANQEAKKQDRESIKLLNQELEAHITRRKKLRKQIKNEVLAQKQILIDRQNEESKLEKLVAKYEKWNEDKENNAALTKKQTEYLMKHLNITEKELSQAGTKLEQYEKENKQMDKLFKKLEVNGKLSDKQYLELAKLLGIKGKNLTQIKADIAALQEERKAIEELNSAIQEQRDHIAELTAENKELSQAIKDGALDALMDLHSTIKDNLVDDFKMLNTEISNSMDLFDEFKPKELDEGITNLDLIRNIFSYGNVYNEWKKAMAELEAMPFSKGLIEDIKAAGPEALNLVKMYLTMTEEEIKQANAAYWQNEHVSAEQWMDDWTDKMDAAEAYRDKIATLTQQLIEARSVDVWTGTGYISDLAQTDSDMIQGIIKYFEEAGYQAGDALINALLASPDMMDEFWANYTRSQTLPDQLATEEIMIAMASGKNTGDKWYQAFVEGYSNGLLSEEAIAAYKDTLEQFAEKVAETTEETAKEVGDEYIDGMVEGMAENTDPLIDEAERLGRKTKHGIKDYISKKNGSEIGKQMDDGLVVGLYSGESAVTAAAQTVAYNALQAAREILGVHSPSVAFMEIGKFVDLGFSIGLQKYSSVVVDSSNALGDNVISSLRDSLSSISDDINGKDGLVIKPLLDLSNIEAGAIKMKRMLETSTEDVGVNTTTTGDTTSVGNTYQFVQNNYSPKALSRIDIYRQTRNQFAMLKGANA